MFLKLASLCVSLVILKEVISHGMMVVPSQRSSLWRFNYSAPINYHDQELFCGGFSVQWEVNEGRCGVCGDRFDAPHPQPNENTGTYGRGQVACSYKSGSKADIYVFLSNNLKGFFNYSICVLDNPSAPEKEECFVPITLGNGEARYNVNPHQKEFNHTIQLPPGLICDRCVLRWHYTAGNRWGNCENGTKAEGCGPQENYVNCADISIY